MMGIIQNVAIITTFFAFGALADATEPRPVALVSGVLLIVTGVIAANINTLRHS